MTEANPVQASPAKQLLAHLDTLRASGRAAHDPVRFRYLDTLAQRLATQSGAVHTHLCQALARALGDFEQRSSTPQPAGAAPPATPALPRAGLDHLKALNHTLRQPPVPSPHTGAAAHGVPELKSVQQFKQAWGRIQVQDQVERALTQGPVNAGPLNSHRLVLRTVGLMQALSPAYLHHFMQQLDTLLQLESLTLPQAAKPTKPAKAAKSSKPAARKTATKK